MMTVPPSAVKIVSKEETTGVSIVDKINAVVSDAAVQSLECKGAGKPLILNKGGFMQTLNFTLTNDDIKLVLQDFASKTRIPLLPGVFKVAYQNLLVTAVVSEFIGNRFLIQKRQPQQPLPLPINAPAQPQRALPARNLPQARPTAPPSMYRK
jgi:hypothetical protein